MKKLIYVIIALLVTITVSCDTVTTNKEKQIIVVNAQTSDTITVAVKSKDVIVLTQQEKELIDSFRPPIRDITYYYLSNKNKYCIDSHVFKCGKYGLWISNGYNHFNLYYPMEMDLKAKEREYLFNIYKEYKANRRLYIYEDELEFVIQK